MSGPVDFTAYQAEALMICLAVSVAWAGLLFFGARAVEGWNRSTTAEKLWVGALFFAVLPSLAAPSLAAFGMSLRPTPEPVAVSALSAVAVDFAPRVGEAAAAPRIEPIDFDKIVSAAAIIYVYGVFLAFFLWASKHLGLYYTIARAKAVEDAAFLARIDDWADRLGVAAPAIRRSPHISSVCIFGVFRQTILIPQGIEARVSADDLVLMCAHELAHVRRGDTRLFTATQLTRVLFWFNPLVARIAARAELAAEEGADALVLKAGVDRRAYAAVFVEGLKFAAYRMNAQPALAPSFTPSDRHGRRRRLTAILSPQTPTQAPFAARLLLSAAGAAIALAAVGQAALAVDPEAAAKREKSLDKAPLAGEVTSTFGAERDVFKDGAKKTHSGVDIKAEKGAKIFAPGDGVVVDATDHYEDKPNLGKVVVVDHGHGLVTRYAHLDSYRVKAGDRVRAGDVIATVGETGKVTGPHLHFETLRDGAPVDPATVIAAPDPVAPVEPVDPIEPIDAPEPVPAPDATAFPAFKIINPVAAAPAIVIDHAAIIAAIPPDDVDRDLLGASDGETGAPYDLTFRSGDMVYRFTSDEPMTAEKRAEIRASIDEAQRATEEARREGADARREADRARREAIRAQDEWRRETERARREMQDQAAEYAWSKEEQEEIRKEFALSRREQLEIEREALGDARADLESAWIEDFDDAMRDLDDAEADLADLGMSKSEREKARASIKATREQMRRDRDAHKRAIESARADLAARQAEIDREIATLD